MNKRFGSAFPEDWVYAVRKLADKSMGVLEWAGTRSSLEEIGATLADDEAVQINNPTHPDRELFVRAWVAVPHGSLIYRIADGPEGAPEGMMVGDLFVLRPSETEPPPPSSEWLESVYGWTPEEES